MATRLKAKELALEGAVLVFFLVALVGILAGADSHAAVLRGLAAAVATAYVGRLPAQALLAALQPPAQPEGESGDESVEGQPPAARGQRAA